MTIFGLKRSWNVHILLYPLPPNYFCEDLTEHIIRVVILSTNLRNPPKIHNISISQRVILVVNTIRWKQKGLYLSGRKECWIAITDLDLQIEESLWNNTIFFDLQEAFSRVWRYYICSQLFGIGFRGNLPSLLRSFLYDRSITVWFQNIYSSHHLIQQGVPQGKVWSVPLFLIICSYEWPNQLCHFSSHLSSLRRRLQCLPCHLKS